MDLRVFPRTVLSETTEKLRNAIVCGYFKPGSRLVEADLCRKMRVSRTSIREALRRLEAEKLVTIVPNKGPSVAEIGWTEAQEIYEVRALLEGEAAALFAVRATADEVAQLRMALDDLARVASSRDPMERLKAKSAIYDVILVGCRNALIREVLEGLLARITFLRGRSMSRPGRISHTQRELHRMYLAILKRKPEAARRAAVEHVQAARRAAQEVFKSRISA
ncbi:MAG TPA: GntR family transcriptional regulator [Vicinamibacterales bacterium]|jgi:DNA-binding GntR family transcriptional regulator|nr:GntR family transcriptional regulator [Vicinamibacterales bacterium]